MVTNKVLIKSTFPVKYKTPTVRYNYRYHSSTKQKMEELPSLVGPPVKPKVVRFYKNGDRNFRGYHVTITPRRFRNFDNLLSELTRVTNLAQGARYVFTPTSGTRVQSLEDLSDGKEYVCGSYPKLKRINYGCRPDGSDRKKPINRSFIPAINNNQHMQYEKIQGNVKPKIITIIRYSVTKPRKTVKVLLNKRTAQTYDQVLNDVTSAVGVDGNSGVRKLYNCHGKLIISLAELFEEDDVFIAVGNEKFRTSDIPLIIDDVVLPKTNKMLPKPSPTPSVSKSYEKLPKSKSKSPALSKSKNNLNLSRKLPEIKKETKSEEPEERPATLKKETEKKGEDMRQKSVEHILLDDTDELHTVPAETQSDKRNSELEQPLNLVNEEDGKQVESNNSSLLSKKSEPDESESSEERTTSSSPSENETSTNDTGSKESGNVYNLASSESKNYNTVGKEDFTHAVISRESTVEGSRNSDISMENSTAEKRRDDNNNDNNNNIDKSRKDSKVKADLSTNDLKPNNKICLPKIQRRTEKIETSNTVKELYDIGKKLGDGNFAVVKEAIDKKSGQKFALKIIDAAKLVGKEHMLENEIRIQRECFHPNIVQLYHDFHAPTEIFLVMEIVSGGDFFDLISENIKLEEDEASMYVRDLCSGLDYLHQRKIVHRDIKPENLMVSFFKWCQNH